MTPLTLRVPRSVALWVVSTLVTAGIVVSFLESYRALYWWATRHAVHGVWAMLWPIQIDAFVAVGELALFVALVDAWKVRHRSLPWLITAGGLAVSIAGNVGHVPTHDIFTRLTAAVPPLTAYVMLAAGLGLLKRIVANVPQKRRPGPKPGTTRKRRSDEVARLREALTAPPAGEFEADDTTTIDRRELERLLRETDPDRRPEPRTTWKSSEPSKA